MKKRIISIALVLLLMFTLLPTQVFAWKKKSHNYTANLILEEMQQNCSGVTYYLEIPPFGKFAVPEEYSSAIMSYPEMFRAGSLGPDVYPDMLTGQGWIHPNDVKAGVTSGDWLKVLGDNVNALPKHSDERKQALSFTLGYMMHYCGDMWGHDFINAFATGSYPSVADIATDEDARKIAFRHMSAETYMDSLIPKAYTAPNSAYTDIDAPIAFITNAMIYDGNPNNGIHPLLKKYASLPPQLYYLVELRTELYRSANNLRENLEPISASAVAYLDRWVEDLDNAVYSLVDTFGEIGKIWASSGQDGDVTVLKDKLLEWLETDGVYATPLPDAIFEAMSFTTGVAKDIRNFLTEKIPFLKTLSNKFAEFKDSLLNDALSYVLRTTVGVDPGTISDINANYTAAERELYRAALKNFGKGNTALDQELEAFYNTLIMMKLVLIGPKNYNDLLKSKAGISNQTQHTGTNATVKATALKLRIKTADVSRGGTNDDIRALIRVNDTVLMSKLLDKPFYDDFEQGDYDTYLVELGTSYPVDELNFILVKRKRVNDDWHCAYVDVMPMNGDVELLEKSFRFQVNQELSEDKGYSDQTPICWLFQYVSPQSLSYTSDFGTGIIDYHKSLDEAKQWENGANLLYANLNARRNIFFKIFKGFAPESNISFAYQNNERKLNITLDLIPKKNGLNGTVRSWMGDTLPPVTGTVEIWEKQSDGTYRRLGIQTLASGAVTHTIENAGVRRYDLQFRYSGDNNYAPAVYNEQYQAPGKGIAVSPESISDSKGTKEVTITNCGTASLTGLTLTLTGTNTEGFALSAVTPNPLAVGESAVFTVTLPDKNANVSVEIRDGGELLYTLPVQTWESISTIQSYSSIIQIGDKKFPAEANVKAATVAPGETVTVSHSGVSLLFSGWFLSRTPGSLSADDYELLTTHYAYKATFVTPGVYTLLYSGYPDNKNVTPTSVPAKALITITVTEPAAISREALTVKPIDMTAYQPGDFPAIAFDLPEEVQNAVIDGGKTLGQHIRELYSIRKDGAIATTKAVGAYTLTPAGSSETLYAYSEEKGSIEYTITYQSGTLDVIDCIGTSAPAAVTFPGEIWAVDSTGKTVNSLSAKTKLVLVSNVGGLTDIAPPLGYSKSAEAVIDLAHSANGYLTFGTIGEGARMEIPYPDGKTADDDFVLYIKGADDSKAIAYATNAVLTGSGFEKLQKTETGLTLPFSPACAYELYTAGKYSVTVTNGTGSGSYSAGSRVEVQASGTGFFRGWTLPDAVRGALYEGDESTQTLIFTMPNSDVSLNAEFSPEPPPHVHSWDDAWTTDDTHHWHDCTASDCDLTEDSQKNGYGEHCYTDDTDASCNDCGYERTVTLPHVHDWDDAWTTDDTHHWHDCTASDCDLTEDSQKNGYDEHRYTDDTDASCNDCGYERTVTPPAPGDENPDTGVPQAGDSSHLFLWVMLMLTAGIGMIAAAVLGKRRKGKHTK